MTTMTAKKAITSVGYATERLLAVLASGVVAIAGLLAVLGFGPDIEERFMPVIGSQTVLSATLHPDGSFRFMLMVDKKRDCRLAAGDWTVNDNGHHSPIYVTNAVGRPAGEGPPVSFPPGMLTIGLFTAQLPFNISPGAYVYANLYYDCHFGWLSRQVLGPVPIPLT